MADRKDLYAVLGVARKADAEAIKSAYRKLARQFHPDVNPDDAAAEERFKEISEAYAILSAPEKRRNYDEFGEVSLEGGFDPEAARRMRDSFGARFRGAGGEAAGHPGGEQFEFGDLDELLGFFRRGGAQGGRPPRVGGHDVEATLELDFLEAVRGSEKRLQIPRPQADGRLQHESVTVRIPAGVADGGRIRLAGKGGAGLGGGPAGDLWATIRVRPHAVFRREGRDLHLELPVRMSEAVRGARVEIPTLEGRATLTVPAGTDSGQRLRLTGKGVRDPNGGRAGDLYVTVQIRVPQGLDDAALAALDELARHEDEDLRKELFS